VAQTVRRFLNEDPPPAAAEDLGVESSE